jgi:hypothetical protein
MDERLQFVASRRVEAGAEVVEARLAIVFFAGEFVGRKHLLRRVVVHVGQRVVGVGGAAFPWLFLRSSW